MSDGIVNLKVRLNEFPKKPGFMKLFFSCHGYSLSSLNASRNTLNHCCMVFGSGSYFGGLINSSQEFMKKGFFLYTISFIEMLKTNSEWFFCIRLFAFHQFVIKLKGIDVTIFLYYKVCFSFNVSEQLLFIICLLPLTQLYLGSICQIDIILMCLVKRWFGKDLHGSNPTSNGSSNITSES